MFQVDGGRAPSEDVIDAVIGSIECRKGLLELSSVLGVSDDLSFRAAVRADEERLTAHLMSILNSESATSIVLSLQGERAQCFLDVAQDVFDRGLSRDREQALQRIIRKLSETSDTLPSSLFITGVTGRGDIPTFGGAFGDIYRASYNDKFVALKHIRHFMRGSELRKIRSKFCREALLWRELNHPNILPFLGIDRESFPSYFCMVSPWMESGTVLSFLKNHGRTRVDKLLHEIAQGLEYLHSRNIVHGDLRGANILITQDWQACLADFGLSVFSDVTASTSSGRAGSIRWMAPELIHPDQFDSRFARTPASDVYAFGCVCFELYTGKPPFAEFSEPVAFMKVLRGDRPERPAGSPAMSDKLWKNMALYWAENPAVRPATTVVVEDMAPPPPRILASIRPLPPIPTNSREETPRPSEERWNQTTLLEEELEQLFLECDIGVVNATLLSEALSLATVEDLNDTDIVDLHQKCITSRDLIFVQISEASVSAEHSRLVKQERQRQNPNDENLEPGSTKEEDLLANLLAANERLTEALGQYDVLHSAIFGEIVQGNPDLRQSQYLAEVGAGNTVTVAQQVPKPPPGTSPRVSRGSFFVDGGPWNDSSDIDDALENWAMQPSEKALGKRIIEELEDDNNKSPPFSLSTQWDQVLDVQELVLWEQIRIEQSRWPEWRTTHYVYDGLVERVQRETNDWQLIPYLSGKRKPGRLKAARELRPLAGPQPIHPNTEVPGKRQVLGDLNNLADSSDVEELLLQNPTKERALAAQKALGISHNLWRNSVVSFDSIDEGLLELERPNLTREQKLLADFPETIEKLIEALNRYDNARESV